MTVLMALTAATLFTLGTYLLLQRKLSRIIIGLGLLSHGANVLLVNAGRGGLPPLIGQGDPADFADPLPQALVLTAIVISFGTTALLLALAYRSWLLSEDDEVADDLEDRSLATLHRRRGSRDEALLATEEGRTREQRSSRSRSCCRSSAPGARSSSVARGPLQRIISLGVLTSVTAIAIAILVVVDRDGVTATQAGDWYAPVGITLVADRLSAVLLVTASIALLAVLVYAIGQPGAERSHVGFQSVYLVLAAGVAASFLTGDLFNLFVAIEMMLTASYVLMTLGGRLEQVRSGMTYVVISLVASVAVPRRAGVRLRRRPAP